MVCGRGPSIGKKVKQSGQDIVDKVKEEPALLALGGLAIPGALPALGSAAGTAGGAIGSAAGSIGSALGSAGSAIGGAIGSAGSAIGGALGGLGGAAGGAGSLLPGLIAGGTSLAGGYMSKEAQKDAARMQQDAAAQALGFQREALEQYRQDLSPYRQFGQSALAPLSQMIGADAPYSIDAASGKAVRVPRPSPGMVAGQQAAPTNELLQQAMQERAEFDPTQSALLSRAQQERLDFDPLQNQLLQSSAERQMAMDPTQAMGPGILQNPLLRAMQEDVTRRLMANQAARGKLGSGGTAEALQQRLVPQAIEFGLRMNELQRQDIADRAKLGGAQVGLQEAAMAGREGLGFGLSDLQRQAISDRMQAGLTQEDLRQRQVANLMDAARLGQSSAARVGDAGQSAASQMGQMALAGGQAGAAGALWAAASRNQMLGGLASAGLGLLGRPKKEDQNGSYNFNFAPDVGQLFED